MQGAFLPSLSISQSINTFVDCKGWSRLPEWDLFMFLSQWHLLQPAIFLIAPQTHGFTRTVCFSEPESKPFVCKHSVLAFETVWHTGMFKNLQGLIRTSICGQSQSVGNCLESGGPFKQEITFTIGQTFPLFPFKVGQSHFFLVAMLGAV